MKNSINKVIFTLVIFVCLMDIFNDSNGILHIAAGFITSLVIFCLGLSGFKPCKTAGIILFAANAVFFLLTVKYKVYLFNILILSYLAWSVITPFLAKFKSTLSITAAASFLSVYVFSLSGADVPLFPIVFYPVYFFGYTVRHMKFPKSKSNLGFVLINILIPAAALAVIFYKVLGLSVIDSITFLRIDKPGANAAVYLPFITIFYLWLSISMNLMIYAFSGLFDKVRHKEEMAEAETGIIKKYTLSFICFISIVGLLVLLSEYTLRGQLVPAIKSLTSPQTVFNIMFFSTVYLALASILGIGLSTAVISVVTLLLIFANFIKIKFFNEPFYPWDVYLLKNAFLISKQYIDFKVIVFLIVITLASVFIIFKFRSPLKKSLKPSPAPAMIPVTACLVIVNMVVLGNPDLFPGFNLRKSWYVGNEEILANGFFVQNYFYYSDLDKYIHSKPANYSYEEMMKLDGKLAANSAVRSDSAGKPNIVLVMGESFWDPAQLNGVTFSRDITENLKKYKHGEIISPVIGGATANAEFEALTGFSMYFMSPGIIPYNAYLRRDSPSIASVLRDNGYSTVAIHPNTGEFYNRKKVYGYLGFEDFIDINGFNLKEDAKGPHVSDDKVVDRILDMLDRDGKPKFIFAVTMQNHDPYNDVYRDLEVRASSSRLNETENSIMSNYAQGIYDADRALGKLINEIERSETPTLVYFFGDHLPRLGTMEGMYDIYNKSGFSGDAESILKNIRLYTVPMAAWSNYKKMEPIDRPFSAVHIAYEVLKDSGIKYPNYFNILNELSRKFPVLHINFKEKVDPDDEHVRDYRLIQYDLLFGEQYLINKK